MPHLDLPEFYRSEAFAEDLIGLPAGQLRRPVRGLRVGHMHRQAGVGLLRQLRHATAALGARAWLMAAALVAAATGLMPAGPASAQTTAAHVSADLQMAQDAAPFRAAADRFVALAQAGDTDATLAMLSRAMVERSGEAGVRRALQGQILPFFGRGREAGPSVTVTRTTDAQGQSGFAFYMWLTQRDATPPRPYTVYMVAEGGRPVVANVVPDQRVDGRHR